MEGFLEHVIEASLPVLKICILASVGALLAGMGVLDKHGRQTLSRLVYFVFTPCLSFSKLAPVLTAGHLVLWMPLALNMFLSVGVGLLLGVLLLTLVRPPEWFRRHVVVTTALGNAGNLPLVLAAALVRESRDSLFPGQAISEDLAIAYVAMGMWAATITHFTVGTHLLKLPSSTERKESLPVNLSQLNQDKGQAAPSTAVQSHHKGDKEKLLLVSDPAGLILAADGLQQQQQQLGDRPSSHSSDSVLSAANEEPAAVAVVIESPRVADGSFGSVELVSRPAAAITARDAYYSSTDSVTKRHEAQQQQWQQQQQQGQRQQWHGQSDDSFRQQDGEHIQLLEGTQHQQQWQHLQRKQRSDGLVPAVDTNAQCAAAYRKLSAIAMPVFRLLWAQASPPMVSCMLALLVGITPAAQNELFSPTGHLLMLQDCINMFGQCCIPCLLLMMGATLSKGPGKACPPVRVVVGITAARLLLLPVLGTGWLLLAHKAGFLAAPDSMFLLVMLLQNCVPTALNVHTLATMYGNREEEVGALLFWQYLAACFTVPAALMVFLWLLKTPAMCSGLEV